MATKLDMISNALILIGDKPLNDLDETRYAATVASNLYPGIALAELSKHYWGFARRKQQLAQLVEVMPDNEYQRSYQLPADMLVLLKTYPNAYDYKIYGKKIYTNAQIKSVDYIANVAESFWPPYFEKLMEFALAKDFAIPIRDASTRKQEMQNEYVIQSRMARYMDSQQHPQNEPQNSPFIEVRF